MRNTLGLIIVLLMFSSFTPKDEWNELLDKNLSKWEMYQSFRHQIGYNGQPPKDKSGALIQPIGFNKNEANVFTVSEVDGEPILRVTGEIYGCLFTKEEFENYHLQLKVKWGERKDDPRKEKLKDSGILYHSIGEPGVDYWRSWMLSQEFQIMEGHMGDYWPQASSGADIRAFISEGKMNPVADISQPFISFGTGGPENFCMRSANYESPQNDWTTLELICFQDKSLHIVNGKVVMVLKNSRYLKDGVVTPLTRGRIQLQSEAAELFFKDIRVKNIDKLPKEYAQLF